MMESSKIKGKETARWQINGLLTLHWKVGKEKRKTPKPWRSWGRALKCVEKRCFSQHFSPLFNTTPLFCALLTLFTSFQRYLTFQGGKATQDRHLENWHLKTADLSYEKQSRHEVLWQHRFKANWFRMKRKYLIYGIISGQHWKWSRPIWQGKAWRSPLPEFPDSSVGGRWKLIRIKWKKNGKRFKRKRHP